jgi:predicted  nucleic acid-binding Zn-ribbon protein
MPTETNELNALLSELHRIHRQLSDLNSRKAKGPRVLKAQQTHVTQLTEKLEETRGQHQRLVLEARELEKKLASGEETVRKRQGQLQEAKSNREYQGLKDQIAADEAANGVLAEEALEAMEKSEAFIAEVETAEAALVKAKEMVAKTQAQLDEETPVIESEIARCRQILADAEKGLPGNFRDLYKRLVNSRGGEDSLAPVQNSIYCGGCNQQVPIHFINEVAQGKPIQCRACGRLLYLPEGYRFP